jgi:hypothetical protein
MKGEDLGMDESVLDRIRQTLEKHKIKETKKNHPHLYWAAIMFFIILIGTGGMSPKGEDILAQLFGTMPEKLEQKDSSVIDKGAERLGVSEVKEKPTSVRLEKEKIKLLIESWRRSWENKRSDDYIAHYHQAFQSNGKDLIAWKRYKKKLNNRYRYISVKILDLKVNVEDSKAWAYFTQKYHSNSYRDYEYKLMEFKKEGHSWKIFREGSFNKKPYGWPM